LLLEYLPAKAVRPCDCDFPGLQHYVSAQDAIVRELYIMHTIITYFILGLKILVTQGYVFIGANFATLAEYCLMM